MFTFIKRITWKANLMSCSYRGGSRGAVGAIAPPKTYESNFIHRDFVQFGK